MGYSKLWNASAAAAGAVFAAALTGGMSIMAVKHGTLPVWLGWLGAAVTVVLLTPLWGPGFIGALL